MPIDGKASGGATTADRARGSAATDGGVPPMVESVRRAIAEQIAPVTSLRDDLERRWALAIDVERARHRLRSGQCACDPMETIGSAGNLLVAYVRATVAIERAGLVSDDEAIQARERRFQLMPLIAAWVAGEPMPKDRVKRAARRAAALVGSSILRRASRDVIGDAVPSDWSRANCPACGGSPEFSFDDGDRRALICSRCDTRWTTTEVGCLGCGARETPMLARVLSPTIDYTLVICNPCGRYIKQPLHPAALVPDIDRIMTQELDAAAEARGLRL